MKTIIVYKSQTGFTKRYALWLQEELKCECESIGYVKKETLKDYDCVIYGGGLMAKKVNGLDKIKKYVHQNLILFATGATPQNATDVIEEIKQNNLSALGYDVPFYYFEGGIHYEDMGFFSKKMLKLMYKSLEKKDNRTDEETGVMEALRHSYDGTKKEYIQQLINDLK